MFKKRKPESAPGRNRVPEQRSGAKVFSYYANREPAGATKRSRNRDSVLAALLAARMPPSLSQGQKILYAGIFTLLLGGLIYNMFLTNSPKVAILGKTEDRLLLRDTTEYSEAARQAFGDSYLNRTKVTISATGIEKQILTKFPELEAAVITLPLFGNTPVVQIKPAPPVAGFVASSGKTYVLDTFGRIISTDISAAPQGLPKVIDQSGLDVRLGEQALPANDVTYLIRLQHQLTSKGYQIDSYTLPAAGRELDVRIKGKPYMIKFSLEGNVLQQAGAFEAVQKQLEAGKVTPTQYIDVRVGDRVYYK